MGVLSLVPLFFLVLEPTIGQAVVCIPISLFCLLVLVKALGFAHILKSAPEIVTVEADGTVTYHGTREPMKSRAEYLELELFHQGHPPIQRDIRKDIPEGWRVAVLGLQQPGEPLDRVEILGPDTHDAMLAEFAKLSQFSPWKSTREVPVEGNPPAL